MVGIFTGERGEGGKGERGKEGIRQDEDGIVFSSPALPWRFLSWGFWIYHLIDAVSNICVNSKVILLEGYYVTLHQSGNSGPLAHWV